MQAIQQLTQPVTHITDGGLVVAGIIEVAVVVEIAAVLILAYIAWRWIQKRGRGS